MYQKDSQIHKHANWKNETDKQKQIDFMTEETEESLYEPQSLRKHVSIADTGRDILSLYHIYGIDNARRGNLYFIDENKIIYASNAAVVIEDLSNGNREYILGIEDGIGCIVVHPSR